MKKIYILLVAISALFQITSYAQLVDDVKTRGIKEVLARYQQYSQFSTDGSTINSEYTQNFLALFDPVVTTEVYNDMAAKKGEPFSFGSAMEYMQYVIKNFPYGIDVTLDLDQMKVVDKFQQKGKSGYIVQVNKKVTGLYLLKNFHRFNSLVYFFISEELTDKGPVYKMGNVLDPVSYQKYAGDKSIKGLYAGISGGYGASFIMNEGVKSASELYTMQMQTNMNFGLELCYMFTRGFGLGTGIGFSTYSSTFSISNFKDSMEYTIPDIEGEEYHPILDVNDLVETDVIKSVDIPLLLKFRTGKGRTALYIDMGIIYSFVSGTYSLEGTQTKSGYYEQWKVILDDDLDEFGFGTFQFNNEEEELKLTSTSNLSAYVAMGLSIPLSEGLFMKMGVNGRYGITDIGLGETHQPFDFSNFIENPGATFLHFGGAEIGLSYNFSGLMNKPKKQSKAEIKIDDI